VGAATLRGAFIVARRETGSLIRGETMPYWQLYYHVAWATKNRESLLTPKVEPILCDFLRSQAVGWARPFLP